MRDGVNTHAEFSIKSTNEIQSSCYRTQYICKKGPRCTAVSLQFACRHSSEQKHWARCGWHILPLPLILFDCSVVPQVLCAETYIRCLGTPDWGVTKSQATPIPLICSCFCCQSLICYLSKFPASVWHRTANWC